MNPSSDRLPSAIGNGRPGSAAAARSRARDFTFIDLFAGIGGLRNAFESAGGECVFTSEWDAFAQQTYRTNFGDEHPIAGDITKIPCEAIPSHDVLVAGFPCQPFSIAGVSKHNALGREHGFACEAQGTLFFNIAQILKSKRPAAFLLENVKNLQNHDKGRTFAVIIRTLRDELGYRIWHRIMDARHCLPQHRQRIAIVGFRKNTPFTWGDLRLPPCGSSTLRDILHPEDGTEYPETPYTKGRAAAVNRKYTLNDHLWTYLQNYAAKHRARGNGFGFGLTQRDGIARTLSARYHKDGSEILIDQGKRRNPRRLTPRECARLMGYPDSFTIPVSDTQAYRQFGNSVAVPVFAEVARIMRPHILAATRQAKRSPQRLRRTITPDNRAFQSASYGVPRQLRILNRAVRARLSSENIAFRESPARDAGVLDIAIPSRKAILRIYSPGQSFRSNGHMHATRLNSWRICTILDASGWPSGGRTTAAALRYMQNWLASRTGNTELGVTVQ